MPDLDLVRSLSVRAAEMSGGRCRLSRLGAALREEMPGFAPAALGFRTLRALVEALPDGAVVVEGHPPDAWFVLGATPIAPTGGAGKLEKPLWESLTRYDGRVVAWYDLEEARVLLRDAAPEGDPERHLPLPVAGASQQAAWARDWLGSQRVPEESRAALVVSLGGEDMDAFLRQLPRNLRSPWSGWRATRIQDLISAWATQHGIPMSTLVVSAPRREAPPDEAAELRAFVLSAVREMSAAELRQLPIPARFFAKSPRARRSPG